MGERRVSWAAIRCHGLAKRHKGLCTTLIRYANLDKDSLMRIALFVPDLRGGGVERVRLLLAREFLAKGHDVDIVLLRKDGVLLDQVPERVRIVELGAKRARQGFMPLVRYLREHRPEALIASMWPLTTMAVLAAKFARYNGKVVVSEHNALTRSARCDGLPGAALRASFRWINWRAHAVVGVSMGVIDDLRVLGLPECAGTVIHNPVMLSQAPDLPVSDPVGVWLKTERAHRLIAVGSLKDQKDYPTLIASVKKIHDAGVEVSLLILGTGPLQGNLERQCRDLGLDGIVHFAGFVSDPAPFYRAAGLFVLSSAWEGFGNVIVEAMTAGIPVVSTDCRSGPAEILEDGRYGRLVPVGNATALAAAILGSLGKVHDETLLRARAAEFTPEKIGQKYLELLDS